MPYSHNDFKYIDIHTHFFPPKIFKAIWNFFELPDANGNPRGWTIKYKLPIVELVKLLDSKNVKAFTTLNYAHKELVADYINEWTYEFVKKYKNVIPFGCVWPGDRDLFKYVLKIFEKYNFVGIKAQPLVQNFFPDDKRLYEVYKLIVDLNKWYIIHAGTAPYTNKYLGYKTFIKFIEKFPNMNVIVAHLGAYEFNEFFNLLDKYENLYFDTSMVYIPENLFAKWNPNFYLPDKEKIIKYSDRILFGSDFPNIPFEYEYASNGLFQLDLPKKIYENVFFNNAKRLFKIAV